MDNSQANNKRIAKNTLFLYMRMLVIMIISLYTSRIVLGSLGITDYGLYNVVGGVVTMFSFINAAMASSTQRYLTYSLAEGNPLLLQKIFNTSLIIHVGISFFILLLCETIGVWFLYHKLIIPIDRFNAAFWVFQLSIISTIFIIMSAPYNATIIAHEKMSAFAYISIVEVLLKLIIAFLLYIGPFDRLILYALLILIVQIIIQGAYYLYCNRYFPETKFLKVWDKLLFKEMLSFASWNLWGQSAAVAFTQGINILLNIFFGPSVNAARAIAIQVQGAVTQFSYNFQTAMNPQIIKSYANNDWEYMHGLIYRSSKLSFFLLLLLSLPILLNTDFILKLWLKQYPSYTVDFVRIILCVSMIDGVANSLMTSAMATGNIKRYQGIVGGVLLAILPISYIVLKLGGDPVSVFIVHFCICVIAFIVRLLILAPMVRLSIKRYASSVMFRCLIVALIAPIVPTFLLSQLHTGLITFIITTIVSIVSVCLSAYYFGLQKNERLFVRTSIINFYNRFV